MHVAQILIANQVVKRETFRWLAQINGEHASKMTAVQVTVVSHLTSDLLWKGRWRTLSDVCNVQAVKGHFRFHFISKRVFFTVYGYHFSFILIGELIPITNISNLDSLWKERVRGTQAVIICGEIRFKEAVWSLRSITSWAANWQGVC